MLKVKDFQLCIYPQANDWLYNIGVTFLIQIFTTQNYSFLSFDGIFQAKILYKVAIMHF
jgi:hypothetical protein